MAKVYYVECPKCKKVYYIDQILLERSEEEVKMKCPYCKEIFKKRKDEATIS